MAETTRGIVTSIKVYNLDFELATVFIRNVNTGSTEIFIMWEGPFGDGSWPVPFDYIHHSIWLSTLRDALIHNLPVMIVHEEYSSVIKSVTLSSP